MLKMWSMERKTDIRVELGRRIRQLRKILGLTQSMIAERASLNQNYYGEIERGLRNITLLNIQRIADVLDVSLEELFRFQTEKPLPDEAVELIAQINRLLQKGNKKKIRQVLVILREFL